MDSVGHNSAAAWMQDAIPISECAAPVRSVGVLTARKSAIAGGVNSGVVVSKAKARHVLAGARAPVQRPKGWVVFRPVSGAELDALVHTNS